MKKVKKCKKYGLIFTARSRLQKKSVFINTDFFCKLKEPCLAARPFRLSKNLYRYQKWVFSVACSAGFASCKTFGKQPKHPCFGRSPRWVAGTPALLVLHRAKLLASNQSILALGVAPRWVAGTPVPVFTPGTDAGRVCTRALHDAKPTKHTQPFTGKRGFSARMPK